MPNIHNKQTNDSNMAIFFYSEFGTVIREPAIRYDSIGNRFGTPKMGFGQGFGPLLAGNW